MTDGTKMTLRESHDPKVPIDLARGLASLLTALCGVSFALVRQFASNPKQTALAITSALFCTVCALAAARVVDWIMDRLDAKTWYLTLYHEGDISNLADEDRKQHYDKFEQKFLAIDGCLFRLQAYAGGYAAYSVLIALAAFFSIWYVGSQFSISPPMIHGTFGGLVSAYVIYQMMTIKSAIGTWAFVGAMCVTVVFGASYVLGWLKTG